VRINLGEAWIALRFHDAVYADKADVSTVALIQFLLDPRYRALHVKRVDRHAKDLSTYAA
jgi:hypothetical protein